MGDEDRRQAAFLSYEQGRYAESLAICEAIGKTGSDTQIAILTARNLFNLGRYGEAESCTRDLIGKMPGTSYLHSFLGKILEARDDDAAIGEYTRAVVLDPGNLEALRSYAAFLMHREDYRMAIPVLRKIAGLSGKEDDYRQLARSLIAIGEGREGLSLFGRDIRKRDSDRDYLDALISAGQFNEAARYAGTAFRMTRDVAYARDRLRILARKDREAALPEYQDNWKDLQDPGIGEDYIRLLAELGHTSQALAVCRDIIDSGKVPSDARFRFLMCSLNAAAGEKDRALGCYEHLAKELLGLDDTGFLAEILAAYREFLLTYFPVSYALPRFQSLVEGCPHVACLTASAQFYETIGDLSSAKSSYYRAFRTDFFSGGIEYVRFLARTGDTREAEKILLHVLGNTKKTRDLETIAGLILDDQWKLYSRKRLLDRLIILLETRIPILGSGGLECLAIGYLVSASSARRDHDYPACKEYCLRGLDTVPAFSQHILPGDFIDLLKSSKEESVCDIPFLPSRSDPGERGERSAAIEAFISGCDPQERRILEFLAEHREATEMDLRKLLNTRRVVGIVNRILQKQSEKGLLVIEKKGSGEGGEIYSYTEG